MGDLLTLEVTCLLLGIARKGNLGLLLLQLVQNLPVGNIAHLMIFFHDNSFLVAGAIFSLWHQSVACTVRFANIAVDPAPTVFTFALVAFPHRPVLALSKRAAQGFRTVIAPESSGTSAFAIVLVTLPELCALKSFQIAVEAWWAVVRSVALY